MPELAFTERYEPVGLSPSGSAQPLLSGVGGSIHEAAAEPRRGPDCRGHPGG